MLRLADDLLDDCLCQPQAPFGKSPSRYLIDDKHAAKAQLAALKPWLTEQQTMLWANRRDAVLLLLQGPDCSGKDGVIRKVINAFDPQGLSIHSFQMPNAEERGEHFLQRYRRRLPAPGLLGVFNRSHYEALISDPLDGLCADADFPRRLAEVQAFEAQWPPRHLHALKCYLHISRAEQKERLLSRLQRPEKRWKLHASDLQAYREHDLRQARWSALLAASHTEDAPWYVIPSDQRWLRDWLVASLLARELERLDLDWPDTPAPFCAADLEQP